MAYNWQQKDWPHFHYDLRGIEDVLLAFAEKTGLASGLLKGLPEDVQLPKKPAWRVAFSKACQKMCRPRRSLT
jgi:hypothetical protein